MLEADDLLLVGRRCFLTEEARNGSTKKENKMEAHGEGMTTEERGFLLAAYRRIWWATERKITTNKGRPPGEVVLSDRTVSRLERLKIPFGGRWRLMAGNRMGMVLYYG